MRGAAGMRCGACCNARDAYDACNAIFLIMLMLPVMLILLLMLHMPDAICLYAMLVVGVPLLSTL